MCLYIASRYDFIEMKSILFMGLIATMAIATTASSFGLTFATAQMADNATMGNLTGNNMTMGAGNMTSGNSTGTGSVSSTGGPGF